MGFIPETAAQSSARVADSLAEKQLPEVRELLPAGIRHRAIAEIAAAPADDVKPKPAALCGQGLAAGGEREHVDDVGPVLVDQHRHALVIEVVRAPTDQAVALRAEVCDHRGDVRAP